MLEKVRSILETYHNRESFFTRIASIYPTLDWRYQMIEKAYNDAKKAFENKYRDNGERYFEHLRSVALIVMLYLRARNYLLIVAALLHDIVEDCEEWTIDRVIHEYGPKVAELVEWMTKPKNLFPQKKEYRRVYHDRFKEAPRNFFVIKLADRLHNLLTIWPLNEDHIQEKIEETKTFYLEHAESHFILIHELEEIIRELEKNRMIKIREEE